MRKLLFVLCVAALAATLALSASAATPDEPLDVSSVEIEDNSNSMELSAVYSRVPQDLTIDEQVEWLRNAYLNAGFEDHSSNVTVCAQSDEIPEETRRVAYMDISKADEEMKAEILAARKKIIYSYDWRNDDYIAIRVDVAENVIEIPPKFSELFPEWDIPVDESLILDSSSDIPDFDDVVEEAASDVQPLNTTTEHTYYNVPIRANNPNQNATPFTTVPAARNVQSIILCWVPQLPAGTESYNVGYTNRTTGQDIAHGRNYTNGQIPVQAVIPARAYDTPVGCRLSTNSQPCTTTVKVRLTVII